MQIKRFEAKDMTAALAKIKQEFGPDAVILSAKSIRTYGMLGGAKTKGVEVTAAIDPTALNRPEQPVPSRRPGDDVVTLSMAAARRQSGGRLMTSINSGLAGIKDRLGRPMPESSPATPTPSDDRLGAHLTRQGINRMLAEKCLRRMGPAPARLGNALTDALSSEGVSAAGPAATLKAPGVMVFVGPPGVGKTTTLIKIATRMAVDEGRRVGLVTLDHKRIGAVEQLQLYADILQLPMETAFDASSFKSALTRLAECDAVVVDTPGIAPSDADAVASLQKLLRADRRRFVHLVIGACMKEEDLDRVVDGFRPLNPGALAVTQFDESVNCGNVVNVLHRSAIPLSWISDGGEIPEDLHPGSVSWLARRLLAGYTPRAASTGRLKTGTKHRRRVAVVRPQPLDGDDQPFVANSNSDIFHRTDCKWTQMIKSENFLSFSSMADALAQGFNPCRYCKPQPTASGKRVLTETGTANMAGYR